MMLHVIALQPDEPWRAPAGVMQRIVNQVVDHIAGEKPGEERLQPAGRQYEIKQAVERQPDRQARRSRHQQAMRIIRVIVVPAMDRSEENKSELQTLMRISYAVFCLKKQTKNRPNKKSTTTASTQLER